MFWKLSSLSASSPVESILDKEDCTLEELLDEDEIIQECKALNGRLINFLRDRAQVEQLLRYIVEEPPEDAESKRAFKFPFIACEIFTCEIDVILKTLVEEEEFMNLLFSFLEPNRPHSAFLAGYFSKVVVCLMLRKMVPLMNYVKEHQDIFRQLVDLIGITSIMEVLVRLVGADDHMYSTFGDVIQWLADSNLLEMIVDKLNPSNPPEVQANAAETLCSITRNSPSPLATKLSSPSFVARIFDHALEHSHSISGLVHSLSVCISLLDPRRSAGTSPMFHSFRSQHMYGSPIAANSETVSAMLPKLGDLLTLLNVSSDEKILPTAYGQLSPPLGKHRLKIVEFIAVLLKTGSEVAEKELISSGTIQRVVDLFFEYAYNNALHHHVESIIYSCLESNNDHIVNYLLRECNLIGKILQTDKCCVLSGDGNQPTLAAAGRKAPRAGNIGHLTRISNKLLHLSNNNGCILSYLQEHSEWSEWRATVLVERNAVENVCRWGCGRPTALQDRTRDSDGDDFHDRDYDVAALADNLSQAFRYNIYENEDNEEDCGTLDRDNEDVYFDDESAEVVISSLRLGEDQGSSLFTNSNWFAFQDDATGIEQVSTSPSQVIDEIKFNGTANGGKTSSDDEKLARSLDSSGGRSNTSSNGLAANSSLNHGDMDRQSVSQDMEFFPLGTHDDKNVSGDKSIPESKGCGESPAQQVDGSSTNPFLDVENSDTNLSCQSGEVKAAANSSGGESSQSNCSSTTASFPDGSLSSDCSGRSVPSLFEEDVEFIGVEPEGTEKAMEYALREGIVGEAVTLKRNSVSKVPENEKSDDSGAGSEFNDANYWRVDHKVDVLD